MSEIKWIEGEPNMDSVHYTADHGGRRITITHDSCRGTTYLDIEEREKNRGGQGQRWDRCSAVQMDTSIGESEDVKIMLAVAQMICDEQDRLEKED